MRLVFKLFYLISAVSLIEANDMDKSETNTSTIKSDCILPSPPEHGSYSSSPEASPGDSLDSFQLNVTCNRAYKLTGPGEVSCSLGAWTQQMPKCRPFCVPRGSSPLVIEKCVQASGEVFHANESKPEMKTYDSCALPPLPKQGSYVSTPALSPGDTVESFELFVTCMQGYELVGFSNISCSSGQLTHPMPECLAPCSVNSENGAEIIECDQLETTVNNAAIPTQTTTETSVNLNNLDPCVLPPYPENGRYRSHPWGLPGHVLNAFQLNVTCKHGYALVGNENVRCIYGMMSQKMPVCLPYCKVEQESTVNCEKNVPRCVFTSVEETLMRSTLGSPDADCGIVDLLRRRRLPVSGGYPAKGEELPWHTGIYRKIPAPIQQICGGTLVSKRVVISAAHCFSEGGEPPVPLNYALAAGKIFRSWLIMADGHAQRRNVTEIKIPPRYQGAMANYQEDIAIVISDEEFAFEVFVKPACLNFDPQFDSNQLREGNLGKIVGWGLTSEDSFPSSKLRAAILPYIDIEKCIEDSPMSFKSSITGDKICAGYGNGTSACRGDSGGGFVMADEEEYGYRYYLRGIISTSPVNGKDCNIYTWVTFTHVQRHINFIKSATRGLL